MITTLSKWGNSQGVRLSKEMMRELSLSIGDKLNISVKDHKIIIEPVKKERVKYNIDDLVKKIPKGYTPTEVFNDKAGLEQW